MNILIIGANFSNKGAEAMMLTVKQEMETRYAGARVYMLCRSYEKELAEKNGIIPVYNQNGKLVRKFRYQYHRLKGKLYKIVSGKNLPYVFRFPFVQIKRELKNVDIVVDVSGFAYADSWGVPVISETIKLQKLSKKNKAKFYFMPQAWGSFDNPGVSGAAREMLSMADKFYARDLISQKYLSEMLATEQGNIPLMHDLVFAYDGSKGKKNILKDLGYSASNKLLVGISPNLRVYEKAAGHEESNAYIQLLLALANYCTQQFDADVIFIPNEVFPSNVQTKDDRYLSRLLVKLVDSPEKCFVVDQYCSAEEISDIISSVDILASSRFHAIIFGFLHSKPVMAISWSHKYKELFKLFDLEEFVMESDEMDQNTAISLIKKLVDEKKEVRAKIESKLPYLKGKIKEMFNEIGR